jgi:translation elongation factor EF-G
MVAAARTSAFDGVYHGVDSSKFAFKIAASKVDETGDFSSQLGESTPTNLPEENQRINAQVRLAEMCGYATQLRSLARDERLATWSLDIAMPVPTNIANEIVAKVSGGK